MDVVIEPEIPYMYQPFLVLHTLFNTASSAAQQRWTAYQGRPARAEERQPGCQQGEAADPSKAANTAAGAAGEGAKTQRSFLRHLYKTDGESG
jgi:hypothetical protein